MNAPLLTASRGLLAAALRPAAAPASSALGVVRDPSRARVACHLCSAIGVAGDAGLVALKHRARETCYALDRRYPPTRAEQLARRAQAVAVHAAIGALPEAERVYVLAAAVRELLVDAPDCCIAVDRALRDASLRFAGAVTEEHEATAAAILEREVRL